MIGRELSGGGAPFDPAKLARIIASLEWQDVAFLLGSEGEAFARSQGAEALYMPTETGRPGIIVLGEQPSCAAVIEELIHLGQHRRRRWQDLSGQIPALEVHAQERLIRLARRWGWPEHQVQRYEWLREMWRKRG